MGSGILTAMGGIGLFLFGMKIMTEALRAAAGDSLREALARTTTTPLRGMLTGALATALVQSSTAITLMTVGFVGAGLMGFRAALGLLYGANIGTTVTGWLVNFLGFKLQLGTLALPVMFVAALGVAMGSGLVAQVAKGVAGLCLLFLGLDMMQGGAALAQGWLTPERLPDDTLLGRIALCLMGIVLVTLLQSSSAGIAMVLVLLGASAISFAQAAALVIGLNIGTTLTALAASLGGSLASRQTGLANLLFNIGTAAMAFPLLDLVSPLLHATALGADDQTALVLFHTGFNLAGAAVFLPLTPAFARLVQRLVPEPAQPPVAGLDPVLLRDPDTAIEAASRAADRLAAQLLQAVGAALAAPPDLRGMAAATTQAPEVVAALEDWLARIALPPDRPALRVRMTALLHLTDHLARLTERLSARDALAVIAEDPVLRRTAGAVGAAFRRTGLPADRFDRLADLIDIRALRHRRATLLGEHAGIITIPQMFRRTDAMRWLAHTARHAERIAHYRVQLGP